MRPITAVVPAVATLGVSSRARPRCVGKKTKNKKTGVLPHDTYGAELLGVGSKELGMLRAEFVKCCGHTLMGAPRDLQVLACGSARDPVFSVRMAPLLRWCREVWLRTSANCRFKDCLLHAEIWLVRHKLANAGKGKLPHGPLLGIFMALEQLGWKYSSPLVLSTSDGFELDMSEVAPAMLTLLMMYTPG